MSNSSARVGRLGSILAAILAIVVLAYAIEMLRRHEPEGRPLGTAEDIAALRERDDVNVLFILVDTLRSDRLSAYGYERETSPRLDRLAGEGVLFSHHLAQSSWTKASMASLWTGLNPTRTGVLRFEDVVSDEATLPAELLREAGFQTIGLYRNGWVSNTFGFAQGFDVYQRPTFGGIPPEVKRQNPTLSDQGTDNDVVSTALEFLRINGHERWFLYMHLMDIHEYVYDEESALFGTTYSDIYDNSIRWTDTTLSIFFEHLEAMGLLDDTIIVIGSDHGEAFQERGFEGHARKVYKETTEVPFILSLPFRLEPGIRIETRTRNVDMWPTVLDLVGVPVPDGLDGRSLVPQMLAAARAEPTPGEPLLGIAHLEQDWGTAGVPSRPTVAVTDGPLRFVRVDQFGEQIEQLFDRSVDRAELVDVSGERPEDVARLRALAGEYLEQEPDWGAAPTKELSELELNHLRALGYALP